jgi:hypothetical protein
MRIRGFWLVVVMVLVPVTARANDHVAEFFGAPSFAFGSTLFGAHLAAAWIPPTLGKDLTLGGEFSFHNGTEDGNSEKLRMYFVRVGYLFEQYKEKGHLPSVHASLGGVHEQNAVEEVNRFAGSFGGGYEYLTPQARRLAASTEMGGPGGYALVPRADVDYIVKEGHDFVRVSVGVALRFYK